MIRRLFLLVTLVSLVFWAGVAWHILQVQPHSEPPPGYPANVAECRVRWAQPIAYPEVRAQALHECERFYALLGDRTAPVLQRLQAQVILRLSSLIIMDYLDLNPPEPGQVVTGRDVVETIGVKRVGELLVHVVTHADEPYLAVDKSEARCRLDEVRRVQSQYDLSMIEVKCRRPR